MMIYNIQNYGHHILQPSELLESKVKDGYLLTDYGVLPLEISSHSSENPNQSHSSWLSNNQT